MPALDTCHDAIVRAFRKAGWSTAEHYRLIVSRKQSLYVDLAVSRTDADGQRTMLLIEVKCFPLDSAQTKELYLAVGQYLVYRDVMRRNSEPADELYLAIPAPAYDLILSDMGFDVFAQNAIKIVLVDIVQEVIVQWS